MKHLFFIFFLLIAHAGWGQETTSIHTIDFVRVKDNRWAEALFFYQNNWKVYRAAALQKGYITSFRVLATSSDTTFQFDLMLMTEYAYSTQLQVSEERLLKRWSRMAPSS